MTIKTRMLGPDKWTRAAGGHWNKYIAFDDEKPEAKNGYGQTALEATRDFKAINEERPK